MYALINGTFKSLHKRLQTATTQSFAMNGPNNIKYITISSKSTHIFNKLNSNDFKLDEDDCYHHFYIIMHVYGMTDEIERFDKDKYDFAPANCEYCKFEELTNARPIINEVILGTACIRYRSIAALIPISKLKGIIIKVERGNATYDSMTFECENGTFIVTDDVSKRYLLNIAMDLPCNKL